MKEFVCIVCPNGCLLSVDEKTHKVEGNKCKKGEQFAIDELTAPKRTLTTTVRTAFKEFPVLPVRVSGEIPKEKIFEVMEEINKTVVDTKLKRGEPVLKNVLNLGVDVIATSSKLFDGAGQP